MNFIDAKRTIDSLGRFGSVLGLDNIFELLIRLGSPQDKLKVIHIAGTNGKGSTIAYLSSILKEAGYKVGKYTSPVVFEYLEKYQTNDKNISEEAFADIAQTVINAVKEMVAEGKGQPTIFEVETAMAYLYFYERGCDVAIIETGMGGDMDATNVCKKVLASVITSISLDHTGFLGDTLQEIARHKAGIIKEGCPVILYGQAKEVVDVVSACAEEKKAPLIISKTGMVQKNMSAYETATGTVYEELKPSLLGVHQKKNLYTALEVIEQLRLQGFDITGRAVKKGVENTRWPGRLEKLCDNPLFFIDGAHNPGAVAELKATLETEYRENTWVFIMGVLADKDFVEELRLMAGMAETVITVTPHNNRALEGNKLADAVKAMDKDVNVQVAVSPEEAVEMAIKAYDDMHEKKGILAFGSLSYLGEIKQYFEGRKLCV